MMGFFGKKETAPEEEIQQGPSATELITKLEKRVKMLERRVTALEEQLASQPAATEEGGTETAAAEQSQPSPGIGINMDGLSEVAPVATQPATAEARYYLGAPSVDGVFANFSVQEQIGKSIYQLTTQDGVNGTFILMDTADAIASAMISISQFIKPVCKVNGNSHTMPHHIITEEEGVATFEAGVWRVTRKAVVRFE